VLQAAIEGQGVVLGNPSLATEDLAAGRLRHPLGFHLVSPRSTADRPSTEAFRAGVVAGSSGCRRPGTGEVMNPLGMSVAAGSSRAGAHRSRRSGACLPCRNDTSR
jgi:hypothetical protein